jgi:hypothetical protein
VRHADYVLERVMSRGSWEAMGWLQRQYTRVELADFLRRRTADVGWMIDPVTPEQRAALRAIAPVLPVDAYLAGGVAIAATLRHRISNAG